MSELRTRLEPLTAPREKSSLPVGDFIVAALGLAWAAEFGWLAVQRHLAGGSHAEDLGFTDQVLANFLRGQFFRMSIYQGATWNTEIDVGRLARPDSLLAFHFEPMLLLLVPLYALGGGATLLLVGQAIAVAAGALPAYRLGHHASGSAPGGVAVGIAYLLSPLGQWAALADFHTSTLAAPLLVLAVERLVVKRSAAQALAVAALAATAREDVGLAIAALGLVLLLRGQAWLAFFGLGLGSTILAALVIRTYSGGVSPFDVRYGDTLGAGLGASLSALGRPGVLSYVGTLALSGGWLGLLAPLALVPALPGVALNVLSTSPWMAAGKAHYSSLILPFIAIGAAAGLWRLRARPFRVHLASGALVLTSVVGYAFDGAGPLGANYAPPLVTAHATRAGTLAQSLPATAAVSASTALVPRVSRRPRVYVFPAVLDADYVFLDLGASPAPTSAGDVFLRVSALLGDGGWNVEAADDGLLLLHRAGDAPPTDMGDLSRVMASATNADVPEPQGSFLDGRVSLLSAALEPSPDGAVDVDGPRGLVRTVWRAERPLPPGTRLEFWVDLRDGQRLHVWDIAPLWWNSPEHWTSGEPVTIDIPDMPMRQFLSWQAVWTTP